MNDNSGSSDIRLSKCSAFFEPLMIDRMIVREESSDDGAVEDTMWGYAAMVSYSDTPPDMLAIHFITPDLSGMDPDQESSAWDHFVDAHFDRSGDDQRFTQQMSHDLVIAGRTYRAGKPVNDNAYRAWIVGRSKGNAQRECLGDNYGAGDTGRQTIRYTGTVNDNGSKYRVIFHGFWDVPSLGDTERVVGYNKRMNTWE